jgi:hypothetical protein
MATLTLKYPRYPSRIETIAEEVREHVENVRSQRIAQMSKGMFSSPSKVCRGFNRYPHELPLMAEYFHFRKRKGGRQGHWNPYCRACNKAKRDYERSLRALA